MDHRLPGAERAFRLYPKQAAVLATLGRLGCSQREMARAVINIAGDGSGACGTTRILGHS